VIVFVSAFVLRHLNLFFRDYPAVISFYNWLDSWFRMPLVCVGKFFMMSFTSLADSHLPLDKIGDVTAVEAVIKYYGLSRDVTFRSYLVAICFITVFGKACATNPKFAS
jgi:hypothetical protein